MKLEKQKKKKNPYYICVFVIGMVLCVCLFKLFSAEGVQSSKLLDIF
jgi:hypothetical protein